MGWTVAGLGGMVLAFAWGYLKGYDEGIKAGRKENVPARAHILAKSRYN